MHVRSFHVKLMGILPTMYIVQDVPPHVVKGGKINWGQLVWSINTMKYQFVPSVMETFFPKMPICRPKYWLFKVTQLIQAANPFSLNEL